MMSQWYNGDKEFNLCQVLAYYKKYNLTEELVDKFHEDLKSGAIKLDGLNSHAF